MLDDKELKVLNLISEDISFENYFFKKVKNIKWFYSLKEKDYFAPEKAPGSRPADKEGHFTIPHWNVLDYLERVSQQVTQPGNEKYVDDLLEIIKNVTKYHIEHNKCLDNYRTWWYFVKILCNIPNGKIDEKVLELIPVWLESKFGTTLPGSEIVKKLLPKLLESSNIDDIKKAEKIVEIVTQIKWTSKYTPQEKSKIEEEYKYIFDKPEEERTEEEKLQIAFFDLDEQEPETVIGTYLLLESFINQKNAIKVGEKCSENSIFSLGDNLKEIFQKKYPEGKVDLSYIWQESLFDISRHISGVEETLTLILRDIVLAKARKDVNVTRKIFEKFLGREYPYPLFRRIVLFIIGSEWQTYKDVFWSMLEKDKEGVFFNDSYYEPEIYGILEKNISQFLGEEKENIKKIIEKKVPGEPHPEEKYREYYSAYQKQKWYSALKSDPYFTDEYEKQRKITQKEEEISFKEPKVRWGLGPSPVTKEEIIKMPNIKLAKYLKNFRTVDFWRGPTIGGLADVLKSTVQEEPNKFVDDLEPFTKTGYLYVYDILWGIRAAWEKKKTIDWAKLFDFIKQYITSQDFWNDKYKVEGDERKAGHLWVTGAIGELIQEGTKDDSWAFSEEYFKIAQEIIFLILERQKVTEEEEIRDAVTHALNSPFGKVITALIYLALRIARIEDRKEPNKEIKWSHEIKTKYEYVLQQGIVEGFTLLGQYLANFYYLDKEWTGSRIKEILLSKDKMHWETFMDGYLFSGRVYEDLYKLMKQHYQKAIDYDFKEEHTEEHLIQHICIGYLCGYESIDDKESLFRKVLDKWHYIQIKEIVRYFWMQNDYLLKPGDKEIKSIIQKIISFWRWAYENKYKDKQKEKLSNEDKKILSDLSKLTTFLQKIDEEKSNWLMLSAPYADADFSSSFFIEYLDKFEDKDSLIYAGKIFLEMLSAFTPDYDQEHIRSIVEKLYKTDNKEDADKICNIYGSRGFEFLRDIYNQYNLMS